MHTPPQKIAYTVPEACAAIGIGRSKFYEFARQRKLILGKLGGRTIVTADSLHRLVDDAVSAAQEVA